MNGITILEKAEYVDCLETTLDDIISDYKRLTYGDYEIVEKFIKNQPSSIKPCPFCKKNSYEVQKIEFGIQYERRIISITKICRECDYLSEKSFYSEFNKGEDAEWCFRYLLPLRFQIPTDRKCPICSKMLFSRKYPDSLGINDICRNCGYKNQLRIFID